MKIIKKTGLVPVMDTLAGGPVFGVTPEVARTQVARGTYQLVDIPAEYETEEVDGPENTPVAGAQKGDPEEKGPIAIPEEWEKESHLKRIKLAKDLNPDFTPPDGKWTADLADEKIKEEVARRTADQSLV